MPTAEPSCNQTVEKQTILQYLSSSPTAVNVPSSCIWALSTSIVRIPPYHAEHTRPRQISQVKQHRARLVLGSETAWEPRVWYSFCTFCHHYRNPSLVWIKTRGTCWVGIGPGYDQSVVSVLIGYSAYMTFEIDFWLMVVGLLAHHHGLTRYCTTSWIGPLPAHNTSCYSTQFMKDFDIRQLHLRRSRISWEYCRTICLDAGSNHGSDE